MALTGDIIAIAAVIGLVAILALPKKVVYAINGSILLGFGLLPLLNYFNVLAFDIYAYPLARYVIFFIVIVAGRELFKEGLKEQNIALKMLSIILGISIIILTAIPTLYKFEAISFTLPAYAPIIDFIIYLTAGSLLLIGIAKATEL